MGSGLEPAGRGFLHAKVFVDVHDEVLRLGERVLLLEGVSDASEVIDRDGVERDRRLEVRMRRLEEVFLEARVGGEALALGMDTDKEPGPVAASMIHGKAAAGLQMDYEDETEREKQVTMTHEIGTSSDISEFRLDYGDLEIEDLGKMAFQEHFLRAWTPKTSEEEALVHSPAATATYGSVLLHPIVRENTEGPAPSATTSGHPIDQPGLVSTFGGPAEAQRFFRRRYGGGYPASYSQDRDETPRPTFPKRIIWSKNEAAVHAPNLPPSQASHSRQPTVTEEAEVEVIPVSRVSETTDVARNIEVACHRANMARLQPGRVELDRMSTLDPRAPLQHGGLHDQARIPAVSRVPIKIQSPTGGLNVLALLWLMREGTLISVKVLMVYLRAMYLQVVHFNLVRMRQIRRALLQIIAGRCVDVLSCQG
ncbi:Cryptochrome-1 [Venturia nashicola]|uniref:Cryptochrome-1 n=1 Tax=Venturia nashicola TaxID=86259 RepID=A0A4Z1NI61_9PEZI|nr:Cryptochrome-1 [Venturia nashicola]